MYHFFFILLDEPGLTSLGGYPDGLSQESKDRYRSFLEEGVSVIAIDKTNDFICGAMLSMMFSRYLHLGTLNFQINALVYPIVLLLKYLIPHLKKSSLKNLISSYIPS